MDGDEKVKNLAKKYEKYPKEALAKVLAVVVVASTIVRIESHVNDYLERASKVAELNRVNFKINANLEKFKKARNPKTILQLGERIGTLVDRSMELEAKLKESQCPPPPAQS